MALVIISALIVRFVQLDKVPSSLFYDEIDLGYQIRSFLTTGKDYRGVSSPFYFKSINTDKTPLPIYFSIPPSLLFKTPEYQVRAGAALAGVICVVLAMILAYQLSGKKTTSFITGLVFAFSPWQIQFSRMAFEAIFMLMVFLGSLSAFFHWRSSGKSWPYYLSAVLLGLNVYTYRTMSLFVPVVVILLFALYLKEFWKEGILKIAMWLIIIGAMYLPFIYSTTIASADQPRINQISIFSDPMVPLMVLRNREVDSNDYANPQIGKNPVLSSFFMHNRIISYLTAFEKNYYKNFSAEFLFLSGDPNGRHSVKNTGELLLVDVIGLGAGLVLIGRNIKKKKYQLILALLILSPIPSDVTIDGANHASRLMIMAGPLLLVIGWGYSGIISWLAANKKYRLGVPLLAMMWLVSVIFYLHQYFVHFPIESSKEYGYGYKQAIEEINKIKGQYQYVKLTANNDPPMLYYLYWSKTPPKEVQKYGVEYGEDTIKNQPLDSIKPHFWSEKVCTIGEIKKLDPKTLYLTTPMNLPLDFRSKDKDVIPNGIKLIDVIKYPNNEVAYYLITRDTVKGVSVQPDKDTDCE